ncbi:shikimate O-hydroxycinnamoyltransferase [Cinnamomum micranthum f. kanehirae]|uniref:Shikimate O-hydroxycinnamoyltransferase n=1 Tax=Cinnamomum micranthum f. kanehirae TaxID=337451 RepID=A0A443PRF5_9MAGN|nr:shikimate O-hydroxycinnamoyltransferase [Cinnamomum micranthum f. kanehirae]
MDFSVIVNENEVVRASLPLEQQWLPLSNLDLLLPPLEFSVFLCYRKPSQCNGPWMTRTLKRSLAQTLVLFYPLSGEVVKSSAGEPVLLCNNRGVDFLEAFADVELREMDFYNTDATIEEKLMPKKKKDAVLSILVTELRCGSFIVSCTFDHRITDAYSANMFLVAWAETAQSKSMSIIPSFQRSLLTPRRPGSYHASLDDMYVLISKLPPPTTTTNDIISRIYYITAEKIDSLQAEASSNGCKRTKLESLSAYLWQKIAQTHTRKGGATEKCKMGIIVNGRTRLCSNGLMSNYFGNVLSIPMGEESAEELSTKPLSWVASAVHGFLSAATCKEHFLGLIDWVEAHRPEPAMTRIYNREKEDSGTAFVVSSGQWLPVSQVDFGWGRPVFGSYHFPWGSECGYVMPLPSASRDGDWVVYIHLLRKQLELLEKEAGAVLRPITPEYYLGDDL